jgi:type I restriction enzyme M protein
VKENGFTTCPSELFANSGRARRDEAQRTLDRVIAHNEGSARGTDSEDDFKGLSTT